jgi:hypothetical protein
MHLLQPKSWNFSFLFLKIKKNILSNYFLFGIFQVFEQNIDCIHQIRFLASKIILFFLRFSCAFIPEKGNIKGKKKKVQNLLKAEKIECKI